MTESVEHSPGNEDATDVRVLRYVMTEEERAGIEEAFRRSRTYVPPQEKTRADKTEA